MAGRAVARVEVVRAAAATVEVRVEVRAVARTAVASQMRLQRGLAVRPLRRLGNREPREHAPASQSAHRVPSAWPVPFDCFALAASSFVARAFLAFGASADSLSSSAEATGGAFRVCTMADTAAVRYRRWSGKSR